MSAVGDCLFNIFASTLHIRGRSSIRSLRTHHAVVTEEPLIMGINCIYIRKLKHVYVYVGSTYVHVKPYKRSLSLCSYQCHYRLRMEMLSIHLNEIYFSCNRKCKPDQTSPVKLISWVHQVQQWFTESQWKGCLCKAWQEMRDRTFFQETFSWFYVIRQTVTNHCLKNASVPSLSSFFRCIKESTLNQETQVAYYKIIQLERSFKGKGKKCKVHPITGHEGPEGEQMYSSTLPSTSALDGVSDQRHAPADLPPRNTCYSLYRRQGGPQGRSGKVRKISPPPGFAPRTLQSVASRYTD